MKSFYGGMFIPKEYLKEAGIEYPIKLEYYRIMEDSIICDSEKKLYGIEIIKTEYKSNKTNMETKGVKYVTNNIKEIDKMLQLLKENYVTPVTLKEVVEDLVKSVNNNLPSKVSYGIV